MRKSAWMYPIVEIVHILGFVILVGAVLMFDLRVLGLGRGLPVSALASHLLRRSWRGPDPKPDSLLAFGGGWNVERPAPGAARAAAALSIAIWIAVIGCGRLIAYF